MSKDKVKSTINLCSSKYKHCLFFTCVKLRCIIIRSNLGRVHALRLYSMCQTCAKCQSTMNVNKMFLVHRYRSQWKCVTVAYDDVRREGHYFVMQKQKCFSRQA